MFPPSGSIPYLIAEIGLNHNGNLELAKKMVDAARTSGAHAAKFQLYTSHSFIHPAARLGEGSLQEFFQTFELEPREWQDLAAYTRSAGLDFFCSIFDEPSIAIYAGLSPCCIKIASCDLTNRPLIEKAARAMPGLPFLTATGCANQLEVDDFASWFSKHIKSPLTILECVSSYPADPRDYNLALLSMWKERYGVQTGISDHTPGCGVAVAAAVLGAVAIEKHFTLDHELPGPDHKISMNPAQFRQMHEEIGRALSALGGGDKQWHQSEEGPRKFGRRAAYAARDLKAGETLREDSLLFLRPGGGPGPEISWAGKTLRKDVSKLEMVSEDAV